MLRGTADLLTLLRLVVVPARTATLAIEWLTPAAALLTLAWVTDGPVGRAAQVATRLGPFDLLVDTAVGAGALAGLAPSASAHRSVPNKPVP